jgi:hypothetical protein
VLCGLGAEWTSDSTCLHLDEFEPTTLDKLIVGVRSENTPILANLDNIKKKMAELKLNNMPTSHSARLPEAPRRTTRWQFHIIMVRDFNALLVC